MSFSPKLENGGGNSHMQIPWGLELMIPDSLDSTPKAWTNPLVNTNVLLRRKIDNFCFFQ